MDTFLQLPLDERQLFFEQTAARRGLPASSVEKDFWVCWTLRQLFSLPDLGPHLTFKGGTSLSKVWRLIERFSEDIDVCIDRQYLGFGGDNDPERAPSKNNREKRLRALKTECQRYIKTELLASLTDEMGRRLPENTWMLTVDTEDAEQETLLFKYPACLPNAPIAYVRPIVKIELGGRSDAWPSENATVRPFAAEQFPQVFSSPECQVKVLAPERTFWEKAMLVHEETSRPLDRPRKPRMARHYYDLWSLISHGIAEKAAAHDGLFDRIVEHRKIFFCVSWVDYDTLRRGRLRLTPLPEHIDDWRKDYEAMRTEMFYGTPPSFDDVLTVVTQFESEFNEG